MAEPAPVDWHPVRNARACEWLLRNNPFDDPYGIIRELEFGHGKQQETWYRLVTWSRDPGARRLVGYSRDPKVLAAVAWERMIDEGRERRVADIPTGYASTGPRR